MKWFGKKKSETVSRGASSKLKKDELAAFNCWVRNLPLKYLDKDIWLKFNVDNGIGVGITVRCGNKECDITDYSKW